MDTQTKTHYQIRFKDDKDGAYDKVYKQGELFESDDNRTQFSAADIRKFYIDKRVTKTVGHHTFDDFPFPGSFDIFKLIEQTTFTGNDTPISPDDIAKELEIPNYFPYQGEQ